MNSDKRGYMIPKTIHYIWIGNEMPSLNKECISTWEQNAPGFDIQFWDLNKIQRELMPAPFFYEMLKKKKYAFAVDYIRCKILYEYGGIYLDSDIELIKDISILCENEAFVGLEKIGRASCGIIGAKKGFDTMLHLMNEVVKAKGLVEMPVLLTKVLGEHDFSLGNEIQFIGKMTIYPVHYFYPYNPYGGNDVDQLMYKDVKEDTYAIHHWAKNWNLSFIELVVRRLKRIFKFTH
ncbi:glycosyltransferase family 32 protein [Hafnia alvei]|uniref:Uncharacterized protein n=1 Tax=Hafnia alvei ATCC 51873 TaxID=1002364 RepID=G9Y1I5_HAFAL|nr:glycosyltransferase [Hafnia alvei]EHM47920.1 hypothetical protein HMPREF0454_00381 [Hafnia alvei ATCC 51873]